jgi:hypothetical protein
MPLALDFSAALDMRTKTKSAAQVRYRAALNF